MFGLVLALPFLIRVQLTDYVVTDYVVVCLTVAATAAETLCMDISLLVP